MHKNGQLQETRSINWNVKEQNYREKQRNIWTIQLERLAQYVHFEKVIANVVNGLALTALGAIQFCLRWAIRVIVNKVLIVFLTASQVLNINEIVSVMTIVSFLTIAVLIIVIRVLIRSWKWKVKCSSSLNCFNDYFRLQREGPSNAPILPYWTVSKSRW